MTQLQPHQTPSTPANAASRPHEIGLIRDIECLRELKVEWNEAAPPTRSEPWQSFGWVEAAAAAFGPSDGLRVTVVRSQRQLAAMAAMVLKRSTQPLSPLRLDILGGEELKEPNRFVWRDTAAMGVLVDAIASERTYPVRLSRLSNNPCVAEELVVRFRKAGWITKTLHMPYPYLRLQAGSISKSLREDIRRARRKAERRGSVAFEVAQGTEADLQRALAIQAGGWKGRNRTAILSSPARTRFFEGYGRSAAADGTLRLSFLTIGGRPAAVHFGVESADAYWLLFIGFDEDYRECSPGMLLLEETISDCARRGVARYNFLGKKEPWIRRWTAEAEDCVVLAAYRPNIHGARAVLSDALYLLNSRRKAARVKRAKMAGRRAEDA